MAPLTTSSIASLKASLSPTSLTLIPSSAGYESYIERWSMAAEKRAGLIVCPSTPADVAKVIQFSTLHSQEIAIGGGMHSMYSSTSGGILISLSLMKSITVDPTLKTITVGGGALWSSVDAAAAKHNLAVVGGTVNTVGVGGLTLGGGYGYLSGKHGLAIDNLLEVEIVLADGKVVLASAEKNQELFWGVRGAGSSLGVVTKFVFRAHEQSELVWGGKLIFAKEKLEAVVEETNRVMEISKGEATATLGFTMVGSEAAVVAVLFYNGSEEAGKAFFAPLLDLGALEDTTAAISYPTVNTLHNESVLPGNRRTLKGSSFAYPLSATLATSVLLDFEALVKDIPDASKSLILFEFLSSGKIMSVPQTATAFANRGTYGNILIAPAWTDTSNDEVCKQWTRTLAGKLSAGMKGKSGDGVAEYKNYDGLGESTAQQIYGVNFERLVELKKEVDPTNVFSKGHNLLPAKGQKAFVYPVSEVSKQVDFVAFNDVSVAA